MADAPGDFVEPLRGYNFDVMIEDRSVGHFTGCEGIAVRIEPIAYRAGGAGPVVHQLVGPTSTSEVVLTRGVTPDSTLWDWVVEVMGGRSVRRTVHVRILDAGGDEQMRYTLEQCWPCEFRGAPLNGLEPMYAFQTYCMVFESLRTTYRARR